MMVQGMGMQQHSYPSHSMHFVLPPPAASAGLTIESTMDTAALPGPLWLTREDRDEEQAIVRVETWDLGGLGYLGCYARCQCARLEEGRCESWQESAGRRRIGS